MLLSVFRVLGQKHFEVIVFVMMFDAILFFNLRLEVEDLHLLPRMLLDIRLGSVHLGIYLSC